MIKSKIPEDCSFNMSFSNFSFAICIFLTISFMNTFLPSYWYFTKIIASVTFDNEFAVHDIKVIESQNGLFIAMPSRKTPNGEYRDIAHPINAETREKIQKAILDAYEAPETEGNSESAE